MGLLMTSVYLVSMSITKFGFYEKQSTVSCQDDKNGMVCLLK